MDFIDALAGIASILGPEPQWLGFDFYWIGSTVFALGISALAAQMLRHGPYTVAAVIWIIALGLGAMGALFPGLKLSGLVGPAFEAGFLVAGIQILRKEKSQTPNASPRRLALQPGGANAA